MQSSKLNSNKSNLVKTVVSFVVTLSLVLSCFSANLLSAGAASYREKINELESKQAKVKEQISSLKSDISDQEKLKDALQDEIDTVQAQIDVYNGQLTEVENRLSEIEAQKEQKQNDLENTKQTFMTRLRDIKAVEELETQANEEKQEIQSIKSEVDAKRAELGDRMKEMNAVISELEGQKSGLEDQLDEYAAAIDEFEAKIQAEAAAAAKNNNSSASQSPSYSGGAKPNAGGWVWPCPGFYYISSYVGPRWGRTHNGLDIAGGSIYGKPIVAARAGTVIDAGWNSGGYGNYVMINHGDGFITIYGHMSSVAAYNGQSVSAGQVIGYVGNSGRSTGPHLHFEVRLNGSVEDPLDYVSR